MLHRVDFFRQPPVFPGHFHVLYVEFQNSAKLLVYNELEEIIMISNEVALKWRKLFERGMSLKDIVHKYSVGDKNTVRRAIIRAGGTVPPSSAHGRKYSVETVKEWAELYKSGKNISEIARIYGTSAGVVQSRVMIDCGIQMSRKRIFTEEHRENLGKINRGRPSPKKGVPISEEQKRKISESVKKAMRTSEMREYISKTMKGKLTGDKHPAWQGGISQKYKKGYKNKYPAKFNRQLRRQIMARDDNTCQHCGTAKDLTVHHIDYDKHNCTEENLITVCRSCNGKFNVHRKQWTNYWQEYQQNREM